MGISFTACQHFTDATPQERAIVGAILNSRRAASLSGWENKTIRGESVPAYTLLRTAIVLPPGMEMTRHRERAGDAMLFEAKFSSGNRSLFTASAVAVSADGYFLTAAHCLDEGACTLVAMARDGHLCMAPARIVWCGLQEKNGPDIGLIHAGLTPAGTMPLAGFPPDQKGTPVFTGGFGARGRFGGRAGVSGGFVLQAGSVQQLASGARWCEIFHDAPLAPGDSGGPLIDEAGRLLGINTQIRGKWKYHEQAMALSNYKGVAVCPDAAWIQALMAADRAATLDRRARKGPPA